MVASSEVSHVEFADGLDRRDFLRRYKTSSEYECRMFCDLQLLLRTEAEMKVDLFSAHIWLLSATASVWLAYWCTSHMATSSWMRFVSHTNFNVAKKENVHVGLFCQTSTFSFGTWIFWAAWRYSSKLFYCISTICLPVYKVFIQAPVRNFSLPCGVWEFLPFLVIIISFSCLGTNGVCCG